MWTDFTQILKEQLSEAKYPNYKWKEKKRYKVLQTERVKMIRQRSKAWQKYWCNIPGRNFEKYKQVRNETNWCMKQEDNLRRKSILKGFQCNPKKVYDCMRHMQSVKDNVTALTLVLHDRQLPAHATHLTDCEFITCILHKDTYWHWLLNNNCIACAFCHKL